jgi:hypothetical protein
VIGGANIGYSSDGMTYSTTSSGITIGYAITWSSDKRIWVACGSGGNVISTSINGVNWIAAATPLFSVCYGVIYNPRAGLFYAVGQTPFIAFSRDASVWTAIPNAASIFTK